MERPLPHLREAVKAFSRSVLADLCLAKWGGPAVGSYPSGRGEASGAEMAGNAGTITLEDVPDVSIRLKRNARAKRISLRVSALDGRVTLTMPTHASERQAVRFAREHSAWIKKAVGNQDRPVRVAIGQSVPIAGTLHDIVVGSTRIARIDGERIVAPQAGTGTAVCALLKSLARARLAGRSEFYAAQIGREVKKITLRDTRSRWGSCSSQGNLMYSWRLIMAPSEVIDYVTAHEVAHFAEMNHSPAFWAIVANLLPEYDRPRRWLRREGHRLHRFHFREISDA